MHDRGARAIVEAMLRRQQAGDDTFLDELVAVDMVDHAAGPQGRSGLARILLPIDHCVSSGGDAVTTSQPR